MPQFRSQLGNQIISLSPQSETHSGGEGRIYRLPQDHTRAAKVYHEPTAEHAAKLQFMLSNPPKDQRAPKGHASIAWPIDLLYTMGNQPQIVGLVMNYVENTWPIINFYVPKARRRISPGFNYRYLHHTARNMAAAFHALHVQGYIVGDVSESNVLVTDTALVTLVDTDSFQVKDPRTGTIWPCPVGKTRFTCRELQGMKYRDVHRTVYHDVFGLAVLFFMLLMEGRHPFQGQLRGTPEPPPVEELISCGGFPYAKTQSSRYAPPPLAPSFAILDPVLQDLFIRCFVDGHREPEARPAADEWFKGLEKAEANLVKCSVNKQHLYGKHLNTCPWCERSRKPSGVVPFPAQQVPVQVPLPDTRMSTTSRTVRCRECGESNAYDQLYCRKCLAFLETVPCAGCGSLNPKRAGYCGYCGEKH